jgi:hypothetical protein
MAAEELAVSVFFTVIGLAPLVRLRLRVFRQQLMKIV